MLANWITLARFPMLVINVLLLYLGSPSARLAGVGLLFVGLMLDTVDGAVARRTGRTSLFGSVLDIAADRTYELVLWVCFADLRLIPTAIPLVVLVRTTLTDALRAIGIGQGEAPFAQHRSALGRFLVGSPWMRTGYAAGKIATFCGLALVQACAGFPPETPLGRMAGPLLEPLRVAAWLTVALCVLRGLPVVIGSVRRHWGGAVAAGRGAGCDALRTRPTQARLTSPGARRGDGPAAGRRKTRGSPRSPSSRRSGAGAPLLAAGCRPCTRWPFAWPT